MLRTALILIVCIGISLSGFTQARRIDTLLAQLSKHPQPDTTRVKILAKIGYAYYTIDPEKTEEYSREVMRLSEKIDYSHGLATAHQLRGIAASVQGDYPTALESFLISLSIQRKIGDTRGAAKNLNNLAGIYYYQDDLEKALHYNQRSLTANQDLGDTMGIANAYLARGMMQANLDQTELALAAYQQALRLFVDQKDSLRIANTYGEIGQMFMNAGRKVTALRYYQEALAIDRLIDNRQGVASNLLRLAGVYKAARQFSTAEKLISEGLELARSLHARDYVMSSYLLLAEIDSLRGRYQSALHWYDRYATLKDSVYNDTRSRQIAELEIRYQTEQNRQEAELLQKEKELTDMRLAAQQTTIHNQRLIFGGGVLLLLLLGAGLAVLYRLNLAKRNANEQLLRQKAETEKQKEELETLNRTKDQWFSILGHDFRYPLHFLQHALSLINEGNLSKREQVMLTRELEQRARNAGNLLDNLLYWAQGQLEEISLSPTYLNLHDLVEQSLHYLEHNAEKKGVIISNKVPVTLRAWADPDTMQLVMRNLLENAIKYSLRGDVIRVEGDETENYALLMVKDQGIGISEEVQAKLFRPEQPYSSLGTARERGTGLGLILSRDVLQRNHGHIQLESEPGKGSTFTVLLPLREQISKPGASQDATSVSSSSQSS
jgi:two-component system, sensor histidine kinase and response regulator